MRGPLRFLAMPLFMLSVLGCATSRPVWTADESLKEEAKLTSDSGMKIRGYVTVDGVEREYQGRVRIVGDELHFSRRVGRGWASTSKDESMVLPTREVAWLIAEMPTPMVGVTVGALVLAVTIITLRATSD